MRVPKAPYSEDRYLEGQNIDSSEIYRWLEQNADRSRGLNLDLSQVLMLRVYEFGPEKPFQIPPRAQTIYVFETTLGLKISTLNMDFPRELEMMVQGLKKI